MSAPLSPLVAWRLAEQESKLLFAYWHSAMANDDVDSAAQLKTKLAAQRAISHEAFVRLLDDAETVSRTCRPPEAPDRQADR